jgi:DNA-binding GntR family transcriptional regulator
MKRATTDETIRRTSIVDTVTERLRRELLSGEIEPGGRIRVGELEKRFGVSHIPIREALRRLEAEGLVHTSPQRATLAAGLALEDLIGLYDLRRLIEVPVARRSAERASDADIEATRLALAELEVAAASAPDSHEFFERHRAFHSALLAPSATAWIQRVLDQLWQAAERYVRLTMSTFGTKDEAMREHREMVELLAAREPDLLADLVARHLNRTEETLREGYLAMRAEREAAAQHDGGVEAVGSSLVFDRS